MPQKPKSQPRNSDLAQDLAVLTERVDANHKALCQQFEDGMNLVIEKLKPIDELKKDLAAQQALIAEHAKQISIWKGSIAVLATLWVAAVSAVAAVGAAVLKRGH